MQTVFGARVTYCLIPGLNMALEHYIEPQTLDLVEQGNCDDAYISSGIGETNSRGKHRDQIRGQTCP